MSGLERDNNSKRFIAVDGGGTKTACVIGDGCGHILAACSGESSNIKSRPWDEVKLELSTLIERVMELSHSDSSQLDGIFLGMAGADRPEDREQFVSFLEERFAGKVPITIHNDAVTALSAGTWGEAGIVLISGTGSIAYGYLPETDTYVRAGGWGYLLGDEGSGFDIGKKALTAVMKQHDGRGAQTELTELILSHWSLRDPNQIITYVYGQPNVRTAMAELAKLVVTAAKSGDSMALTIMEEAIEELAELALTVNRRLADIQPGTETKQLPLVLSGGVFSDDWFMNLLGQQTGIRTSGLRLSRLRIPPVAGCYILALKQAGITITELVKKRIGAWETGRKV
ncbi:BadF-type ATPase [Paenibacillus sp. 1_12]|uniref:N-acetylglucosamine kinase n=1 Tax=Paenibacillus sp. 1_12 TaxID=1566278 RepID=UPI0008E06A65|nr:BadF/BadG/BcrA/BcrD ATPase family protein [Paenibacillus sp. 1_12]SFM07319.1 BadF-type ATPase [Paenibacillus sp. 1_12]